MKTQGMITALVLLGSCSAAGAVDLSAVEILNRMRLQASITQTREMPPANAAGKSAGIQPAALADGSQPLSRETDPHRIRLSCRSCLSST